MTRLKEKGLVSRYLKAFVIARIDPTRFSRASEFDFDQVIEKMIASAKRFNVDRIRPVDIARSGSPRSSSNKTGRRKNKVSM